MLELNKVMFVGRLTRDPEVRFLQSGSSVASFTIAVGRRYKNSKTNEMVEETAFIPVKAWNKQAEFVEQYFKKGQAIYVEGRMQQENWEKEGQKQSRLVVNADRISFAESRAEAESRRAGGSDRAAQPTGREPRPPMADEAGDPGPAPSDDEGGQAGVNDDLPF